MGAHASKAATAVARLPPGINWDDDSSDSDTASLSNGPAPSPIKTKAPLPPWAGPLGADGQAGRASGQSRVSSDPSSPSTLDTESCSVISKGSTEKQLQGSGCSSGTSGTSGTPSGTPSATVSMDRGPRCTRTSSDQRGGRGSMDASGGDGSTAQWRASMSSEAGGSVASTVSGQRSGGSRSSFACERVSLDIAFREAPSPTLVSLTGAAALRKVPVALDLDCAALAIIMADMPVPVAMLQLLWAKEDAATTRKLVMQLADLGILRVAELDNGSTWCLVAPDHQRLVQEQQEAGEWPAMMRRFHNGLVDRYCGQGKVPLGEVVDDGYFMQQVAHHLAGAGRLTDLRALLSEPAWVEAKLHAYGNGAVVADFRRYLQLSEEGSDVKLLLQAFELSRSGCLEHPACHMLREQMLARLMMVAQKGSSLQEWSTEQSRRQSMDAARSASQEEVVHLMPRTATLQQAGGLHRMTLRGHRGPVRQVVISPSGQDVITIGDDGGAQVFDMNVGDSVMQVALDEPLSAVALTPDGRLAVLGGADGTCAVWELTTGDIRYHLLGHTAKINAVAIDRVGRRCVTASDDASVRLWNLVDGRCEHTLGGHGSAHSDTLGAVHDVAISWDGSLAASASVDCTVRVWDLNNDRCLHVLEGHAASVKALAFIGSTLCLVTASHDCTARVWDALTGHCLHVLSGHTGPLNKVCVDFGGQLAVTCSDDASARVWQLSSGKCLKVLQGHNGWVSDAAVSRDGLKVVTVSGDSMGAIWDVASGTCDNVLEGHAGAVGSVALTFRGRFAVTASEDCTARVWDLQASSTDLPVSHDGKIKSLQALEGGTCVVSVAEDGKALVWDAAQGVVVRSIAGHSASVSYLATQSGGATFVTGSSDRQMCQWSSEDGRLLHVLPAQQGSRVKSMAVDGAGTTAVVVLYDSTLGVWDLRTGGAVQQLTQRGDRDPSRVHAGAINAALITRDGRTAVTISKDCTARVWDVAARSTRLIVKGHMEAVTAAVLSPDETILATGSLDNSVHITNMADGAALAALDHPGPVTELAFSPDGTLLAALVDARRVVLWDLKVRKGTASLVGHREDVAGLLFSPDSRLLVTYADDCTVRVWRTHSGAQVAFFVADAAITSVCFAGARPACHILAVGDARGVVHFLDFPLEVQHPSH